jgi:hypothetical protein
VERDTERNDHVIVKRERASRRGRTAGRRRRRRVPSAVLSESSRVESPAAGVKYVFVGFAGGEGGVLLCANVCERE